MLVRLWVHTLGTYRLGSHDLGHGTWINFGSVFVSCILKERRVCVCIYIHTHIPVLVQVTSSLAHLVIHCSWIKLQLYCWALVYLRNTICLDSNAKLIVMRPSVFLRVVLNVLRNIQVHTPILMSNGSGNVALYIKIYFLSLITF